MVCSVYFFRVSTILTWVSITFKYMAYQAQLTQILSHMDKWVILSLATMGIQPFRAM
ncbi:hypothetical protein LOK49_LG11G00844 [Camellia lanceoleosa]|uniref:Uncharacterized protein n=1 Tax=Camellia lanceoleosa TaxID=1840588 RepID=A0ACC0G288_9ERIC|nr:hypothetical protein LOK49_LG11G00844 [Camellia lanceoleosa]